MPKGKHKGLLQAYQIQDLAHEAAFALADSLRDKETGKLKLTKDNAAALAQLVKAWEAAQYRIQVHRRVPNPGSLKHSAPAGKRKVRSPLELIPLRVEPKPAGDAGCVEPPSASVG